MLKMLSVAFLLTLRMKRLWVAGFSLALILLPDLGFAETQQLRLFPEAKQIALPQLSDGLGWKQPKYHSTIQTADVDGDGQDEVLARWIDGLSIYRFENGTLLRHSRLLALSDNAGFDEPSWYSTIHTAVLDRKLGQADVVAREHDGIHVFRYDSPQHEWRELGSQATVRPFSDTDVGGTDWTKPKHYLTIQLADLTGDGVAELVGRGQNGMQVWRWNAADESWAQTSAGGELSDSQGFDQEPHYYSIQLVDVDNDGVAELIARAPAGVQTYKGSSDGWTMVRSNGPFGDDPGFVRGNRYKSMRASVDATGRAWLYGLAAGTAGAGSGAIQIHLWNKDHWQLAQTLPLPGSGWDRESQFATVMAADIHGDAQPEFLVRGPYGLHAFTLSGDRLPMHSQSFTDAQGWNLTENYSTLQPAVATLTENGGSHARALIVGRGTKGLEVYKFTGEWTAAAQSNFPQYCANLNTDLSPQCLAYRAISSQALAGVVDIRSYYTQFSYRKGDWKNFQDNVNIMPNPIGPNNAQIWQTVHTEMVNELGYVATVRGWFENNYSVLNDNYSRSADLLGEAVGDVDFATSKTVTVKWLEMGLDIVSRIAAFIPGDPGKVVALVVTILEETYNNLTVTNGDINQAITQIYTDLNRQKTSLNDTNATQQTAYLTDYSKLQQIGKDSTTGGYDWANATLEVVADAQNGAAQGMLINFYKTLVPYKWWVYWCRDEQLGPHCGSHYTPAKYDCQYGWHNSSGGIYDSQAYLYAGYNYDVNWRLVDKLTGTGKGDVNAVGYMLLLGSQAGWDLPAYYCVLGGGCEQPGSDPRLATGYYWYPPPHNAGCDGNGPTSGQLTTRTLSQRLTIAQQNTRHVTASEANGILKDIRTLKQDAKAASPDGNVEIGLTSPLREAAKLIERAKMPRGLGQEGSVSATTPTHLMELFV
ncbi:MAG TPA: VCBS repeat-containing protein, partial [Bryobacteraceae bacterium]|nr:VCBS repeat-containing protein [Bryobacteraceae bacterium]